MLESLAAGLAGKSVFRTLSSSREVRHLTRYLIAFLLVRLFCLGDSSSWFFSLGCRKPRTPLGRLALNHRRFFFLVAFFYHLRRARPGSSCGSGLLLFGFALLSWLFGSLFFRSE